MKYLLDVNALVALGFFHHEFHDRVAEWIRSTSREAAEFATCSITELGFIRVLGQVPQYDLTISQARTLLLRLKAGNSLRFTFISDDHDISHLPSWARTPNQTTDGHLAQLAKAHGAILATLDRGIPGALLIPASR
jgi:predicted nucleic acid-binding protein